MEQGLRWVNFECRFSPLVGHYSTPIHNRSFKERNIDKEPTRYKGPANYKRSKQTSKDPDVPKGPIDVWKLLRETIEKGNDGRDSKGIENEK